MLLNFAWLIGMGLSELLKVRRSPGCILWNVDLWSDTVVSILDVTDPWVPHTSRSDIRVSVSPFGCILLVCA